LLGELSALGAALVWAVGNLALKPLSTRFHPLLLSHLRCLAAALLFVAIVGTTGGFALVAQVPPRSALIAIAGTFAGIGIGDTLFVLSLRYIGVSRGYPLAACGYPLITIAIGYFALQEPVPAASLAGMLLVLGGLYFVAFHQGPLLVKLSFDAPGERKGLILLLLASISWGASVVGTKLRTAGLEMPIANLVRFSGTVILLTPMVVVQWARLLKTKGHWRNIGIAGANGAFTYGVGAVFFVTALGQSGAAMTAVLSSTSPLFLVPLAVIFFKETVTPKLLLGVALSVLGICLVFLA
jgi:drug/metabolite transporter (DMT)-like permease